MPRKISGKPPRYDRDYSIYFLTFCTYDRKALLHQPGIPEMLIENLRFYGKRLRELIGYTIMPDHIHLLMEVEKVAHLSAFLRDFKKRAAKEIKTTLSLTQNHIWQRGTMDHCIRFSWSNKDFENHIRYLYYNCYKHLGIAPKDFPYHNFMDAVSKGWLDMDFFSFDETRLPQKYE